MSEANENFEPVEEAEALQEEQGKEELKDEETKDVAQKKKSKKLLRRICIALAATIALLIAIVWIIDLLEQKNDVYEEEVIEYNFYIPDFDENIYENEEYLSLLQSKPMIYQDAATGHGYGITRGETDHYGADVTFMVEHVYTIIEGDHETYNDDFSDEYYDSGRKPKERFTMQKIYNVQITRTALEKVSDGDDNYTKYSYELTYQIYENNGTFRRDIGAGAKTQYIILTDRTGELLIDSVSTVRGKGTAS